MLNGNNERVCRLFKSCKTVTFSKCRYLLSILPTRSWKQFFLRNQQALFGKKKKKIESALKNHRRREGMHQYTLKTKAAANEISMDAIWELDSFFTISEEH